MSRASGGTARSGESDKKEEREDEGDDLVVMPLEPAIAVAPVEPGSTRRETCNLENKQRPTHGKPPIFIIHLSKEIVKSPNPCPYTELDGKARKRLEHEANNRDQKLP